MFTIWDELGLSVGDREEEGSGKVHEGPFVVVMLGDLKHGRTVHSLAMLLARSSLKHKLVLRYCSPPSLAMPAYVKEYVASYEGVTQEEFADMSEAVKGSDVLYVTRVQKERFESTEAYDEVKGAYIVDKTLMDSAPSNMIVMHPLPRVDEISTEVDTDQRLCYFRQMENGMFVRMAILALVLGCP
jgi:carbamoyl-phosphate synthase/aspartate carbamoyltransferase/dihydroorotase